MVFIKVCDDLNLAQSWHLAANTNSDTVLHVTANPVAKRES